MDSMCHKVVRVRAALGVWSLTLLLGCDALPVDDVGWSWLPEADGKSNAGGPARSDALGIAVADYMIRTWPRLDATAEDCTGPENCFSLGFANVPATPAPKFWEYTYGVPVVGVQKLFELTHEQRYLDYVRDYVDRYVSSDGEIDYGRSWPVSSDGTTPAPNNPTIQDVIQPSSLLFGLYAETGAAKYLDALANTRDVFHQIQVNSSGAFWHKPTYPEQQWLDGIYMAEPTLVRYGALFADARNPGDGQVCFDTAVAQIKLAAEHTYDPRTGLYFHAWNGAEDGVWRGLELPKKVPPLASVSPVVWARSLAWFITGIVDVLEYLPQQHPDRDALLMIVSNIAAGLERYQDPQSGLWYQVVDVMNGPLPATGGYPGEVDKPAQPNWTETSASALFTYSLAKAVRLGVLPRHYRDVARRGWAGVKSRVERGADGEVLIHGTVVGMSVGGTYNAYVNADFRTDVSNAELDPPAAASCPQTLEAGTTPPLDCKYLYVRDNVPQGFGAVLLASSEMELRRDRR